MEYLCLVVKFRATTSRQFNRLMCSIPRKSTEGRQNCEYVGKTNRSCLCHCPESTDSEDQTCTGTTQSMQTDYQLRPETTLQGQLGSIWVQLTQLQPSILKLGHCLMLCHSSKTDWLWELVSDYSKDISQFSNFFNKMLILWERHYKRWFY